MLVILKGGHRSVTPLLRYSVTPLLRYSVTPLLRYSVTPLLRYSVTPLLRYSVTPLLRYSVTPLLRYSVTPLLRYSVTPLLRYSVTPLLTKIHFLVTTKRIVTFCLLVTEITFLVRYSSTFCSVTPLFCHSSNFCSVPLHLYRRMLLAASITNSQSRAPRQTKPSCGDSKLPSHIIMVSYVVLLLFSGSSIVYRPSLHCH